MQGREFNVSTSLQLQTIPGTFSHAHPQTWHGFYEHRFGGVASEPGMATVLILYSPILPYAIFSSPLQVILTFLGFAPSIVAPSGGICLS